MAGFDRELGPYTRRLVFYELRREPERMAEVASRMAPELAWLGRVMLDYSRAFVALRYGAGSTKAAEHARVKIVAGFERLEAELEGGDYLADGRFTVADLTAASSCTRSCSRRRRRRSSIRCPSHTNASAPPCATGPAIAGCRRSSGATATRLARHPGSPASKR